MIELRVTGVKELQEKFAQLQIDFEQAVAGALVAGCFPVSNDAKRRCRYKTGNARRSIHIGTKDTDVTRVQKMDGEYTPVCPGAVESVRRMLQSGGRAELFVGTDVSYTWNLEFVYGYPFLRPALDENRDEVNREARRALEQVIRKAAA